MNWILMGVMTWEIVVVMGADTGSEIYSLRGDPVKNGSGYT
jgi:hypothetical protein